MPVDEKAALIAEYAWRMLSSGKADTVAAALELADELVSGALDRAMSPDLSDFDE